MLTFGQSILPIKIENFIKGNLQEKRFNLIFTVNRYLQFNSSFEGRGGFGVIRRYGSRYGYSLHPNHPMNKPENSHGLTPHLVESHEDARRWSKFIFIAN